jgi:hypothetical protein
LTRLERLDREKQSIFLRTFLNYGCKKFYNTGQRAHALDGSSASGLKATMKAREREEREERG